MGLILFDFFDDALDTPPIVALGPSGQLIPDMPDAPLRETWRWSTDVIKSWDGAEHRISFEGDIPAESASLGYTLEDPRIAQIRADLYRRGVAPVLIPQRSEAAALLADASGFSVVVDNTYLDWLIPGQRVMVENQDDERYVGVVQSSDPGPGAVTVALDTAAPGTFRAGLSHLFPVFAYYLEDNPPLGQYPKNAGQLQLNARRIVAASEFGTGGAAAPTMFGSTPILEVRPSASSLVQQRTGARAERIDYGGVVAQQGAQPHADIQRSVTFLVRSAEDRQFWKRFLRESARGRQRQFLFPTWKPDLTKYVDPTGTSLRIISDVTQPGGVNFQADWFAGEDDWPLRVEYADGSAINTFVYSVTDNLDGTQTLDVLDDLTGVVSQVSFLESVRLASDEVTVEHGLGRESRLSLSVIGAKLVL